MVGEEVCTGFWWGDLMERGHLEGLGVYAKIILEWIFKMWDGAAWTGLILLRIRVRGSHV
jgi:hypothetical protein